MHSLQRTHAAQPTNAPPLPAPYAHYHAGFVARFAGKEDLVTMHVGLPPGETFPLTALACTTQQGDQISITDPATVHAAQQYCFSNSGHGPLVNWAKGIISKCHKPTIPFDIVFTAGSVRRSHTHTHTHRERERERGRER